MIEYSDLILNKDGKPLRILQIGKHTCIRVIRISEALISTGYEVDVLTNKISYGVNKFDMIGFWFDEKQFKKYIKETLGKYDIYEVHNEPDVMIRWVRDVVGDRDDIKIIHNAHDVDLVRRKVIPIPERQAFNAADAVIYVAEPIRTLCNDLHKVKVPTMVLYNYPTQSMIDDTKPNWNIEQRQGLVYEGGVNPIDKSQASEEINKIYPYRNLFHIFQQLIAQGNEVHVYAGNSTAFNTGQHTGCVLHPPTVFNQLLVELTKYRYNLLIFNNEKGTEDQVNFTTPNKMWDALASGLPSLGCYCRETMKYLEKHNIGWVFNNIAEISNCSQLEDEYEQMIENVKKKRNELIFERQIWRTENLYAGILGVEKKGIPDDIKKQAIFEYGDESTMSLLN
jgi:hypothetical protein